MSELEKEVLSDISKMIQLKLDRPLPPEPLWSQIENAATMAVISFLGMWWLATIIKF